MFLGDTLVGEMFVQDRNEVSSFSSDLAEVPVNFALDLDGFSVVEFDSEFYLLVEGHRRTAAAAPGRAGKPDGFF